jgi:Cyclin, C-terminal domain
MRTHLFSSCPWPLHSALSWRVHPPTAYCFGKHILYLLPCTSVTLDDRHAILELARFLTELSVIDYFFVIHKPSVVAFAAILNAMEDVPGARSAISIFCSEVLKNTPLDPTHPNVARDYASCMLKVATQAQHPNDRTCAMRVFLLCACLTAANLRRIITRTTSRKCSRCRDPWNDHSVESASTLDARLYLDTFFAPTVSFIARILRYGVCRYIDVVF